jgi:uncharacterized protein YaiI (UPF0178 family)
MSAGGARQNAGKPAIVNKKRITITVTADKIHAVELFVKSVNVYEKGGRSFKKELTNNELDELKKALQ